MKKSVTEEELLKTAVIQVRPSASLAIDLLGCLSLDNLY
jgi:hypothetical protein